MRWLRGISALAVLALVLVGAPFALLSWGRVPSGLPAALTRPDDGTVLLAVLTIVGWLAWTAFTAATVAEAVRLLSGGRRRVRIPLLGGLQQVSAGLILAVLALGPSTAPAPAPSHDVMLAAEPDRRVPPDPGGGATEVGQATEDGGAAGDGGGYLVVAGDDLWTVSERLLGSGGRWRELVSANPERLQDPTRPLTPGTRLAVPAPAAAPGTVSGLRVTVERGDTLSGLALEHLGAAGRWPRIAAANADLISDPDHIEVGWRLTVPGAERPRSEARPEPDEPDEPPVRSVPRPDGESSPSPVEPTGRASAASSPEPAGGDPSGTTTAGRASSSPAAPAGTPSPESTPAPAAPAAQTPAPATEPAATSSAEPGEPAAPEFPLFGTIGTLAAAAIVGTLETRRFLRLRERPVGRRLIPPDEPAARLRTILGTQQRPDRLAVLDAALRTIGRHCHERGLPLPELARVLLGPAEIVFEWAEPAFLPPSGFNGTRDRWTVPLDRSLLAASDHPCPYPAIVSLATTADGDVLLVDAERSRVLGVAAEQEELRRSTIAAMGVELACASWAAELSLVVVGADADLVALAGGDRVRLIGDQRAAASELTRLVAQRRRSLADVPLGTLRVDPDRADAVAPVVFVFVTDVPSELAEELDDALAGPPTGVVAILATASGAPAQWEVGGDPYAPVGHLAGSPGDLVAHGIPEATRVGIAALLRTADDPATTPAPWWNGEDGNVLALPQRAHRAEEPVDIVRLTPAAVHPQVLLIGPADLTGAGGPEPSRSRQQLVETCAWLLEHPGSTATAMAAGLAVAESTRRSNLSRLRTWLGDGPEGQPYLPDAYSGRILLDPAVTSDWHRLDLLLRPGIDRVGDSTLVAALELVRGAPLADAAPGQWHWAEELRTDISSALRDTGLVLTDRALARGDIDLARWAAARALVVAPEDEQLVCARIRTEHRAGNRADVERLVRQVAQQARVLGVDLLPETVELCQQVIEGRTRARQA